MSDLRLTPAALAAAAEGDFANALVAATPGGIEAQEAEGQRQMASQFNTLPKDMDREPAKAFGFEFGDDADDIFVSVTAPDGWFIRPTDHSMHSDIIDDKGRIRGGIFYKAAFYDRKASGHWKTRYGVEPDLDEHYYSTAFKVVDRATGTVLFSETVSSGDKETRYERQDAVERRAVAWLAAHFPEHRSPVAYWP